MQKCVISLTDGQFWDDNPSACLPQRNSKVVVRISECAGPIDQAGSIVDLVYIDRRRLITRLEPEREDAAWPAVSIPVKDRSTRIPDCPLNALSIERDFQFVITVSETTVTRVRDERVIVCIPGAGNPDEIVSGLCIKANECIVTEVLIILRYQLNSTIVILSIKIQSCIEKTRSTQSLRRRFNFYPAWLRHLETVQINIGTVRGDKSLQVRDVVITGINRSIRVRNVVQAHRCSDAVSMPQANRMSDFVDEYSRKTVSESSVGIVPNITIHNDTAWASPAGAAVGIIIGYK